MSAIRLARAFTGRDRILKFEGAYHGNHDYASFSQFPTAPANYPFFFNYLGGHDNSVSNVQITALGHLLLQNATKS